MECSVVVLGLNLVGKTSLITAFMRDTLSFCDEKDYIPTLIDSYRRHVCVDRDSILINITDTNGSLNDFTWIENELRSGDTFVFFPLLIWNLCIRQPSLFKK